MIRLIVRCGDETLRFELPGTEAAVGSSTDNDIVIPFAGISRQHARLVPAEGGLLVRDLASRNGVIADGVRVEETLLKIGRAVHLGPATLSLEDGSTSDVVLAIRMKRQPRRERGLGSTGADPALVDSRSPGAALKVIRAFAASKSLTRSSSRHRLLSESREILGAISLTHFSLEASGDFAIAESDGPLPDDALLKEIAGEKPSRKRKELSMIERTSPHALLLARLGSAGILALFPEPVMDEWKKDFFGFLSSMLLQRKGGTAPAAEIAIPDHALRVPTQMVVGSSISMGRLMKELAATVHSPLDILILGETGTGKELLARTIHESGPTPGGPFVAINCAAIPSELLESELFGVQGRVATGVDPRQGLFVKAHGGSIFLDEIGELAMTLQAKLLRFFQEREVLPLGANTPRRIVVRVISASNRDLYQRVQDGAFRADLFYRLRSLQFHLPPLRERKEDIPQLVLEFVERAAEEYGKEVRGVSRRALDLLIQHDWPGNIRELEIEIRRSVLVCPTGSSLQSEHLGTLKWLLRKASAVQPEAAPAVGAGPASSDAKVPDTLQKRLDDVERSAIEEALQRSSGNRSLAARLLGITRNGLTMKLARLGRSLRSK